MNTAININVDTYIKGLGSQPSPFMVISGFNPNIPLNHKTNALEIMASFHTNFVFLNKHDQRYGV